MAKLNIAITNQCNRKCLFCFEEEFKQQPARFVSLSDIDRICNFARIPQMRGPAVCILGGEPTLHPELTQIVRSVRELSSSANIQLLTNLLCDPDILEALAPFKANCLINVGGFADYSPDEQERVRTNLEFLRTRRIFRWLWLAVTIYDETQNFDFLYDILENDQPRSITALRIAISNPGQNFANRFPREPSLAYGDKYLEIVQRCHQIRPLFSFVNECFVNMCMMSDEVYSKLDGIVLNLSRYCTGTLDILPDLSTHWCFAFQGIREMVIPNILQYRNMDEVRAILRAKAAELEDVLGRQCDTTSCTSLKCVGPCLATKYYRKYIQE